jgi:Major Facilitator Superfamily
MMNNGNENGNTGVTPIIDHLSYDKTNQNNEAGSNYVSMDLERMDRTQNVTNHYGKDDNDHHSVSPSLASIASSVITADGIQDVVGFHVVCLVILIGDMSRGIFFPTLWPLVDSLGGSTVTLGYAVAAFSGGRIFTSPLFGYLSVTMGYTRTLLLSVLCLLLGTLTYAQVQNVGNPEFLILAQAILGMGSGTLGVTRAFVADVTAKRFRTTYMAWITAVQYAGFTVTPFIGALLIQIFGDSEIRFG